MSLLAPQSSLIPEPFCIISVNSGQENPNKLFLGGIPSQATEKQLEEFFSKFGVVRDVRIVTDRITAECKGYGFVTFDDKEDIQHLVDQKTIRMSGKKIRIRKAIRRNSSQFDHIHGHRSSSDPIGSDTLLVSPTSLEKTVSPSSIPIVIPRDPYIPSESRLPPESLQSVENFPVNPMFFPISPSDEAREVFYDFPPGANISPNSVLIPSVPELGGILNHQNMVLSPSPTLVHPNYPMFPFQRFSFPNVNTSWYRY